MFLFKAVNGCYNLEVLDFVSFVGHSRTRNCDDPNLILKVPCCKTTTFKSSFFHRIVFIWNCVCKKSF